MKFKSCTLLITILILSLGYPVYGRGMELLELIRVEESLLPPVIPKYPGAGREISSGPVIEIVTPNDGKVYTAPVEIRVRFIAKEGKEIDISTIKVEYVKIFTIDLTPRVIPYTTKDGIVVPAAKLPPGNHIIRLKVGDVTGAVTEQVLRVSVQ